MANAVVVSFVTLSLSSPKWVSLINIIPGTSLSRHVWSWLKDRVDARYELEKTRGETIVLLGWNANLRLTLFAGRTNNAY